MLGIQILHEGSLVHVYLADGNVKNGQFFLCFYRDESIYRSEQKVTHTGTHELSFHGLVIWFSATVSLIVLQNQIISGRGWKNFTYYRGL